MKKIGQYILHENIHETDHSIIYRGYKDNESQPVIIKLLKTEENPSPSEIARFRQEYELLKSIDLDGVIKTFDLISRDGRFFLVMEDFNGVSIKRLLNQSEPFDLKSFLDISAGIAHILGSLHKKKVIHRDIKPHNLLLNQETGVVKITDFGISTILTSASNEVSSPAFIAGTLAYMSPEQTGRMNRGVDYRTDLYSFGVTMYEMLTGGTPFTSLDPMELIHSHLAVMPEPPNAKVPHIPVVLSDIIMKLLSKNPEERYQNAFGLEADLRECIRQYNEKQRIDTFELAMHDISGRFMIPPKIFGREKEIETLIAGFNAVAVHEVSAAVMVVSGDPGVGKSALVNEIYKPIVARRGYFISGKYEQFRRDKPYSAIIQAFQVLIKQILSESKHNIGLWRKKILAAVGENGKLITDVIPEVELIIGKQPGVPALDPAEARNRLTFVIGKFVNTFSSPDHPVVLFLDDFQWTDLASLQFLKAILTGSELNFFYLIVSYRENDESDVHQVADLLTYLTKHRLKVDRITLGPLKTDDIKDLLTYFLKCTDEKGSALAEIVARKTGGNPFFINTFMLALYNDKLIVHEGIRGWQWDAEKLSRMQMTDNMVDMLAGRIGKLSANAQTALKICACIGNRFDLETLAAVLGISVYQALVDLTEAIEEEMVSQFGDMYVFHHDRIQEAAYSLVPDNEKSALHYKIGRRTLENADETERQKKLFYIVDQLNMGADMIIDGKEKAELARLNLETGIKAKESAAYQPSINYLQAGIDLLENDSWDTRYDLTLALYTEMVEACYVFGDFNRMNRLADIALAHAHSALDKERIYFNKINSLKAQWDYEGAIRMALPVLREFGLRLPEKPSKLRVAPTLFKTMLKMRGVTPEKILAMDSEPRNEEEVKMFAMGHIMATLGQAAFFINPNLFGLVALKGLNLSLKLNKSSEDFPFAIAAYGVMRLVGFGDIDGSYRLVNMAMETARGLNFRKMESRLYFVHNMLIRHWKEPVKTSIEGGMEGFRIGKETGDFEYASWNLHIYATINSLFGTELTAFEREISRHNHLLKDMNQESVRTMNFLVWQSVLGLMGRTDDPLKIKGEMFDEDVTVPQWIEGNNRPTLAVFYIAKMFLYFLFNDSAQSITYSSFYSKYRDAIIGSLPDTYLPFLDSFARLSVLSGLSWPKKLFYLGRVRLNLWKLKRWARYCPENKLQLYYAIDTLWDMVLGKNISRALAKVDLIVNTARDHNNLATEAIVNEMAGKYILELDEKAAARHFLGKFHKGSRAKPLIVSLKNKLSGHYFTAAYRCYEKWGIKAKMTQLRTLYPDLIDAPDPESERADNNTVSISGRRTISSLDTSSVMKASQAISEEILLDSLLAKLMKIVIENAGAQRGYLILASDGELNIAAREDGDSLGSRMMPSLPLNQCDGLCRAIVNYVYRSGENIILGNAAKEGPFINDPYIRRTNCKSILCTTIMNQGVLTGILYMENNLSEEAFTPERLEVLRILSAQAAISIENAKLFDLATTDGLTKLYAYRYFRLLLDKEMKQYVRHRKQFAIIMMDIDDFKSFNDTYGHQLGDTVLRTVARAMKETLRAEDIMARYGGEEFIAFLPETNTVQAMTAAERLRACVAAIGIPQGSKILRVTISIGVSIFPTHSLDKEMLIHVADIALYTSKRNGKNRVTLYSHK